MKKIVFYYNDGSAFEKELLTDQSKDTIEIGVLRGLYSIALDDPQNFKEHFMIGYEVKDGEEVIDAHIYTKVARVKKW